MLKQSNFLASTWLLAALLVIGCSLPDVETAELPDDIDIELEDVADDSDESADADAAEGEPEENAPEFVPPHPERTEPFQRPDFTRTATNLTQTQDDIQLKGFVNVDGWHAVLVINKQLTRVRAGETRFGLQVIDVKPPKVILQRGRTRWTQSLFASTGRRRDAVPEQPAAEYSVSVNELPEIPTGESPAEGG